MINLNNKVKIEIEIYKVVAEDFFSFLRMKYILGKIEEMVKTSFPLLTFSKGSLQ